MRLFPIALLALTLQNGLAHPPHHAKHVSAIMAKLKHLEGHLSQKVKGQDGEGHLLVNGPLPADFAQRFTQSVAEATGSDAHSVKVLGSQKVEDADGIVEVSFKAPTKVIKMVEDEAADANSKLARGNLHSFLVAKDDKDVAEPASPAPAVAAAPTPASTRDRAVTPVEEKGIDIDTNMPYGDLEPFGREDTAQELTESSVRESDQMVDQLERAEVAEEKRAVFRALTRLRGAAITSFDGVARSQTGNIDEYNKVHKWRRTHPLHHLADEESDVSKWAFPDNADLLQQPKKK